MTHYSHTPNTAQENTAVKTGLTAVVASVLLFTSAAICDYVHEQAEEARKPAYDNYSSKLNQSTNYQFLRRKIQ